MLRDSWIVVGASMLVLTPCAAIGQTPACPTREIFVLDRTTQFGPISKRIFKDGIEMLFSDDFLQGQFSSYEIHGSGLGYQPFLESQKIPLLEKEPTYAKCPIDIYKDSFIICKNKNQNLKQQFQKKMDYRSEVIKKMKNDIINNGILDAPDSANTVISTALASIARKECQGEYCVFYMMSDLIERQIRPLAHAKTDVDDKIIEKKADVQYQAVSDEVSPAPNSKMEILIWGVGRDEIVSRTAHGEIQEKELDPAGVRALRKYWLTLLKKIGFDINIDIEFEFPNIKNSGFPRSRNSLSCKARS